MLRLERAWWCLLAAAVATGLLVDLTVAIVEPTPAGQPGTSVIRFFSYFTEESNILVLTAVVPLVSDPQHDGRVWRVIRVMSLLGITITGLVYGIVLAGTDHPTGPSAAANILLHYASPIMSILGWLIFEPRPRVTFRDLCIAIIWPIVYVGYILAQGPATAWYPYGFLNVDADGYAKVAVNLVIILVLGVVILGLIGLLDGRLPRGVGARRTL